MGVGKHGNGRSTAMGVLLDDLSAFAWRAADGRWTWASPQWTSLTGLPVEASFGEGWLEAVHPDDRDAAAAAWRHAGGEARFRAEMRLRRGADSPWRWFRMQAAPAARPTGAPGRRWLGAAFDVDDLHRMRERQAELFRESQHHARRTLALIRALVRRSAEPGAAAASYAMHLDGRLDAFARVESIVSVDLGSEVQLDYLVAEELAAHGAHEDGVIRISGPTVRLRLSAAQAVGLAVHELVTHAVEHGALLDGSGAIRIRWQIGEGHAGRELRFDWEEESGSARRSPAPDLALLEKMLTHEMNAGIGVAPSPRGFSCRIVLPLPAVVEAASF